MEPVAYRKRRSTSSGNGVSKRRDDFDVAAVYACTMNAVVESGGLVAYRFLQ